MSQLPLILWTKLINVSITSDLHLYQVATLEANADMAAAEAAEQISHLRIQMAKAEAILTEQRVTWQAELSALGANHQANIDAAEKEYVEAVEGFEW